MGAPRNQRMQLPRRGGVFLLLAVLLGGPVTPTATAQARHPIGTYVLFTAGQHQLPVMVSRIVPGEGATLRSARLELMAAGKLRGEMVVSFTDSGTITDTTLVVGRWDASGDSVRLTYQWSRPRSRAGPRVYDAGRRVSGRITDFELTLPNLAYLNEEVFGKGALLHFRRVR